MSMISVIIPVFNAEKTIKRCISSIINTDYTDYEIIIIDDGSTDASVDIIKNFSDEYSNIILIKQKNTGPSAARNKGLELAQGDIITFVDSDDYVKENYLSHIAEKFNNTNADVVFFEFCRVTSEGNVISVHKLPTFEEDYYNNLINLSENDIFGYTWIKAFKKSLIGDIRFEENIKLYEDEIFSCKVLRNSAKIAYLNEQLYYYVRYDNTLANKINQDFSKISDIVWTEWCSLLRDNVFKDKVLRYKANHIAVNCKWYALERKIKAKSFYKDMASSEYIKTVETEDKFINAIKNKKWWYVLCCHIFYKSKVKLYKFLNNNE